MRLELALSCCLLVVALAGCGSSQPPALSLSCTGGPGPIRTALKAAPGPVSLPDGTKLSACVADADDDGELQEAGALLTRVADDLAADGRALQLGYLVGAARRGGAHTNGVGLELVHRIEASARRLGEDDGGPTGAALERGLEAGERTG